MQERSPLAEFLAEESENGETRDSNFLEEEDRIFSWQDKVFGPFEIDFYTDEKNCLTDCQREYHRRIRDEQLRGARLYSYTENDSYFADDDLLTVPYRQGLNLTTIRYRTDALANVGFSFVFITFENSKHFHSCPQVFLVHEERERVASCAESEVLPGAV